MTSRPKLATIALGIALTSSILGVAQTTHKEPKADDILDAIQDTTREKATPNEVTVTLDSEELPSTSVPVADDPKPAEASASGSAVRVTGKPPADFDPAAASNPEPPAPTPTEPTKESPKPEQDLAVRVEKLQLGNGAIDPAEVALTAPFPAKPLAAIPAGWHLDISDKAPPFTRDVDFAPGAPLTLTIRPHVLVPDADGADVFSISEPGYHHPLGYRQTTTVGAILSNSIRQLDDDSKKLGNAIDHLQQLLSSLPRTEPQSQFGPKPTIPRKK